MVKCRTCGAVLYGVINEYGNHQCWSCAKETHPRLARKYGSDYFTRNIQYCTAGDAVYISPLTAQNNVFAPLLEEVAAHLKVGKIYILKLLRIRAGGVDLQLKEFPDIWFPAAIFERCSKEDK